MIKKLIRHRNGLALTIEKPILELLNITEETKLKVWTDGQKIFVGPYDEELRPK